MGRFLFMGFAVCCAMAVAAFAEVDLLAKCRCDGCNCSKGGAKRAARQERRACKRGAAVQGFQYVTPDGGGGNSTSPYGIDQIQEVGAASSRVGARGVEADGQAFVVTHTWATADGRQFEQRCYGTYCKTIAVAPPPVPAAPQAESNESGDEAESATESAAKEERQETSGEPAAALDALRRADDWVAEQLTAETEREVLADPAWLPPSLVEFDSQPQSPVASQSLIASQVSDVPELEP